MRSCYAAILEIENRNTQALTLLGTLRGQRGEFEESARLLARSLSMDQRQPLALNNLGNTLNKLKRHDDAVASYDKAIALTPDQPSAHNNRGNALRALKRHGPFTAMAFHPMLVSRFKVAREASGIESDES